ncbi:MAG: protein translocase subunit SecF [Gemmatimonadetes bacterium]|nr:protein translocase subunit SecF [Gemmatimonadota bacterium]MBT8477390.1 protein translocase subunit SecF [Gemmatimonadota bacterium]
MRFFRNANFDFLGVRRRAYVVSGVLLLLGIGSLVLRGGPRYGVDFTGGTMLQVEFVEQTSVGDLRDVLSAAGMENAQIQQLGDSNEFLIRTQDFEGIVDSVNDLFEDMYGADGFSMSADAVGPKVGSELQRKAAIAILLSFALTLVYLAFRFEWRFGVAAIIATFHDITITFGFISLFNIEITLATVAAILTILGYSLNDTIVVFDRIRENLKKRRKDSYADIVNASINETLPRTVLTSGTTLATLLALFILGGTVVRPFALVLILGVVIGTYSSIFVASPALLEIEERSRRKEKKKGQS